MKIFYDYQIFEAQKFGGISRYFYELIKRNNNYILPIKYSANEYLKNDSKFAGKLIPALKKKKFGFRSKEESNLELNKRILSEGEYDIFHPTYFTPYFLDHIDSRPFVLTVHDMIAELFPEHFPLDEETIFYKRELIYKANRIIAVSNTTKRDIIRFYPEVKDKIDVVYHGCAIEANSNTEIRLPDNYILYVGHRNVYKNFYFFIQAIQSILSSRKDLHLVCTGPGFNDKEIILFERLGLKNKIVHFFADETNLFSFYANSKAFVYPSLYEGFGIPILEAHKAKCPVILSNTEAFQEVASDSAVFFDPKDPEALRSAVINVLDNPDLRLDLINQGLETEKKFSLDITYAETCNTYKKVIQG